MKTPARFLGLLLAAALPASDAAPAPRQCDLLIRGAVVVASDGPSHV